MLFLEVKGKLIKGEFTLPLPIGAIQVVIMSKLRFPERMIGANSKFISR